MSNHTKGPWSKDAQGWVYEADVWENQDLILATPDLLAALQELLEAFNFQFRSYTDQDVQINARAAIAKATGDKE